MTVVDRRTQHHVTPQDKIAAAEAALARFEREKGGTFTARQRHRMTRLKREIDEMRRAVGEAP
ncbi:MAG: hypothetical protein GTN69_12390 [Armatimonadetes bacterium]|nr:hypothetical protein [Armatimonadota bacterium]